MPTFFSFSETTGKKKRNLIFVDFFSHLACVDRYTGIKKKDYRAIVGLAYIYIFKGKTAIKSV